MKLIQRINSQTSADCLRSRHRSKNLHEGIVRLTVLEQNVFSRTIWEILLVLQIKEDLKELKCQLEPRWELKPMTHSVNKYLLSFSLCARTFLDEQHPCLHGIIFQVGESHSRLSFGLLRCYLMRWENAVGGWNQRLFWIYYVETPNRFSPNIQHMNNILGKNFTVNMLTT